jgi:hypothetical protein
MAVISRDRVYVKMRLDKSLDETRELTRVESDSVYDFARIVFERSRREVGLRVEIQLETSA